VCNLTTPAQYFHALRRQLKRDFRRPLIIMTPKSLLRHPRVFSPVEDFVNGRFQEVLDDPRPPKNPGRLVLCSGKVFYDILERREKDENGHAALVRLEQFYPFPGKMLEEIAHKYEGVDEVVWVQEESQNRAGWWFMQPRLRELFPDKPVRYVGRVATASPATGSLRIHRKEQDMITASALGAAVEGAGVVAT
jgi:2-oxoglutarate dehydrogenase E1 component